MWHVSSRSGVATLRTLVNYLLVTPVCTIADDPTCGNISEIIRDRDVLTTGRLMYGPSNTGIAALPSRDFE